MFIHQTEIVDAIGVDDCTDEVVLTISDQLEWDKNHLILLQEKLNTYLNFVESGEILSSYPNSKNRKVHINLICKYSPDKESEEFLSGVGDIVEGAGMRFTYKKFNPV